VDPGRKGDLVDYYMFVWKLFYAEYLLIPLFA
jgi:homogentisate phytyltransferase/homogentisate geranylgeranyltransferase